MLARKCPSTVPSAVLAVVALVGAACSENGNLAGASDRTGGAPGQGGASPQGGQAAGAAPAASGGGAAGSAGAEPHGGALGTAGGGGNANGGPASGTGGAANAGGLATGGEPSLGGTASGRGGAGSGGAAVGGASSGGSAAGGGATGMSPEPFTPGVAPAAARYFRKGINLGNRLEAPNEGDWGGTILATDLPFIAARGFDHVRIPIRFSGHALTGVPYTIDSAFFTRVDAVLDQAAAAELAVVLDLHAYDDLAANVPAHRERFLSLWTQIAARYADRPDSVAFELLNEPYAQLDTSWNELSAAAIQVVRAQNPRRLLVVDAVYWADPSKLAVLTLPNDANLLVAVHMYEPKLFSFQGKDWMGPEFMTTGVIFPGPPASPVTPVAAAASTDWAKSWFDDYNSLPAASNPSGPATIAAQLAYLTSYRTSSGRSVYNGEWGPQDGGALDSRVRLVTLVREECEKAGVGWAIWEDPNNMKLFDSAAKTWVTEIADALLPP